MSIDQIIRKLYWEEELSQQLVAQRLGCSSTLISKLMKNYNIPRRTLSEAQLIAAKYERKNFNEIRRKAQQTMSQEVRLGLRRWIRPGRHKSKIVLLEEVVGKPFKEILRQLYNDKQMSCKMIADYLNKVMADIPGRDFKVHEGYVARRLEMFNIPRRTVSQATKLAMDQLMMNTNAIEDMDIFEKTDKEKKQILCDLYWNQNLTQELIGRKIGVSTGWVGKKMKELDIPKRTQTLSRALSIKEGRINPSEVIKKSNATIARQVTQGERQWNRPGKYVNKIAVLENASKVSLKEIIKYMYWDCQFGLQDIADSLTKILNESQGKEVKLTKSFVHHRMEKYEIPRRSSGETRNILFSLNIPRTLSLQQLIDGLRLKDIRATGQNNQ